MRILSINPAHDSSIAIIKDGIIEKYYKEERLSRIKKDKDPYKCLQAVISNNFKIDLAVVCSPDQTDPYVEVWERLLYKIFDCPVYNYSDQHHLCHASMAFYNSGFHEALVFVIDRNGSNFGSAKESESVYHAKYNDFKPIYKSFWLENKGIDVDPANLELLQSLKFQYPKCNVEAGSTVGIVKVYESATSLIGLNPLENGKTMGLSGYGQDENGYPDFFTDNKVNDNFFIQGNFTANYPSVLYHKHLNKITSYITEENYHYYANYALKVQKETQQSVLSLIEKYSKSTNVKNICIVGGYGLNVVANRFYSKSLPICNFYIEPNSDDSGCSIGAGMAVYRKETGDTSMYRQSDVFYHGDLYSLDYINGDTVGIKDIASELAKNKIVAVYYGKAEAGPRALGNRSILFNAQHKNAKDIINKIKKREWYRPFGGSVLAEDMDKYFIPEGITQSPYMTMSYKVKNKDVLPGITHIDNTCRIQTVDDSVNHLYKLLHEYKKITNCSVLLNTSFNLAGDPIVDTLDDAIDVFNKSDIDILWFPEKQVCIRKIKNEISE